MNYFHIRNIFFINILKKVIFHTRKQKILNNKKNMVLKNEKELIKLIKNKSFNEIKDIIENNQIKIENLNYFQDTILFLIKSCYFSDIIKIFVVQRQHHKIDNKYSFLLC